MTDIPQTSPERLIIWSPRRTVTQSRRRPVDVPVCNFWIFVLLVKNRNRYVIQILLLLENNFSIKPSVFVLVPWGSLEGSLQIPDVMTFRGPSGDVPGTLSTGLENIVPILISAAFRGAAFIRGEVLIRGKRLFQSGYPKVRRLLEGSVYLRPGTY